MSLVDASHGDEVPEVVIMASKEPEEALLELLDEVFVRACVCASHSVRVCMCE